MDWNTFWESVSVLQLVGWVLGILGLIAFFVKGWPKIRAFVRLVDSLADLPEFMETTTRKLEEVHHETHLNNGGSIKDSTIRTEAAVERVEIGMKAVYDELTAADQKLREDMLERTTPPRKRATKPKETP